MHPADLFAPRHLTREQTEQTYKAALQDMELQYFQHRANAVMNPDVPELKQAVSRSAEQLRRLEADYAAWQQANQTGPTDPRD